MFDIESSARSGSTPFRIIYGPLQVGQEFQLHMWVHFLQRAGALAGGTPAGPAEVTTIRYPDDRGTLSRTASRRAMRALEALPSRGAELHGRGAGGARPGPGLAG